MANSPVGRKIRISSLRNGATSRDVEIRDANTYEGINGVKRVVITLDVDVGINEAEITYYELGDKGGVMTDLDGKVIEHTTKVQNVEIDDITAFEIMDNIRKEMR